VPDETQNETMISKLPKIKIKEIIIIIRRRRRRRRRKTRIKK